MVLTPIGELLFFGKGGGVEGNSTECLLIVSWELKEKIGAVKPMQTCLVFLMPNLINR